MQIRTDKEPKNTVIVKNMPVGKIFWIVENKNQAPGYAMRVEPESASTAPGIDIEIMTVADGNIGYVSPDTIVEPCPGAVFAECPVLVKDLSPGSACCIDVKAGGETRIIVTQCDKAGNGRSVLCVDIDTGKEMRVSPDTIARPCSGLALYPCGK